MLGGAVDAATLVAALGAGPPPPECRWGRRPHRGIHTTSYPKTYHRQEYSLLLVPTYHSQYRIYVRTNKYLRLFFFAERANATRDALQYTVARKLTSSSIRVNP